MREERIDAADCFWMVCLGAVTAEGTLGGDLTVYPAIKIDMTGLLEFVYTCTWPGIHVTQKLHS